MTASFFLFSALAAQLAALDEAPAPAASAKPASAAPWPLEKHIRYIWRQDQTEVGETLFRIRQGKEAQAERFLVEVKFRFEKDLNRIAMQRDYEYSGDWRLERFHAQTDVGGGGKYRSRMEIDGNVEKKLEKNVVRLRIVNNGDEKSATRFELEFPDGGFVLLPEAIEFWALHSREIMAGDEKATATIAYPFLDKLYEMTFTPSGREAITLGGRTIECRGFQLASHDRQLEAELWLDRDGRLIRYRQGKAVVELEAAALGDAKGAN